MPDPRDTPAMRQHTRFKKQHPGCVLLFRIGDFYEMFDEDAVTVSKAIGLTLTQRTEGIPMCGMPYHQLEVYLRRLIQAGFRVAVCEQVQDAKDARGVIDRAVTRVLTPGTLVDEALLEDAVSNKLAGVFFAGSGAGDDCPVGVAVAELSTGQFTIFDCDCGSLADELARRGVRELVYAQNADGSAPPRAKRALDALGIPGTARPAWQFRRDESVQALLDQYGTGTLAGFGLREDDIALPAAGAIVRYLRETQAGADETPGNAPGVPASRRRAALAHLAPPKREDPHEHCVIDATSLRALEVERTIRGGGGGGGGTAPQVDGSLLGLFLGGSGGAGGCRTPMGKRLVRDWLCRPLGRPEAIGARQGCVSILVEDRRTLAALTGAIQGVQDVYRITARVALGRATPRDIVALGRSLGRVHAIAETVREAPAFCVQLGRLTDVGAAVEPFARRVVEQCVESPPHHLREGGLFKDGVDAELDEARLLQRDASAWLAAYQKRLIDEHALPGIKVGFNKVFGYYIELTASQARQATLPASFGRKQTLKNAERYTTAELRQFEERVTTAEARANERERALFEDLCDRAGALQTPINAFAETVAELDVLCAFADRAARRGWTRPEIVDAPTLVIHGGRHPVLEELLGQNFVPNDVELGPADRFDDGAAASGAGAAPAAGGDAPSLALITGPNMAGKSTFIRQTALLALLAHTGSFIPADRATIGLIDRIFTRVGAEDALHAGQSTFMVEMTETANILHHATGRSLVILDEIGRGTSTLDGLSLAWAITEHLALGLAPPPRTLFATHYHELTELEDRRPGRVKNLHVSVREWGDDVVFLHRILPGRTDRSYGIHVAKLAGLPPGVVRRAREILESLAVHHAPGGAGGVGVVGGARPVPVVSEGQLSLFTEYLDHPVLAGLRELKLDSLSPMQAFDALRRFQDLVEDEEKR